MQNYKNDDTYFVLLLRKFSTMKIILLKHEYFRKSIKKTTLFELIFFSKKTSIFYFL